MKIRRFSVENFRCWKKVSFQLASPQRLMIFWGQNGSGKAFGTFTVENTDNK